MRKNLTLLIAGILLLATAGVAQAQVSVYQVVGSAVTAREGGAAEATGSVVLSRIAGETNTIGTITVQYSAPVSGGQPPVELTPDGAGTVAINDDGLTTITLTGGGPVIILRGIRVDVREVTGEVTAAVLGDGINTIVSGTVTVISSIEPALDVSTGDAATSVLTRGTADKPMSTNTAAEAWVTIKEGFAAAFTSDVGLTLKIEGLPKNAKLNIFALGKAVDVDAPEVDTAGIQGDVNIGAVVAVVDGDANVDMLAHTMTGDGKDMTVDITFNPSEATPSDMNSPSNSRTETLTLTLALDANMGTGEGDASVALPLMGEIRASVTMMPVKAKDMADGTPYFTENFVPGGGGAVFIFDPASCTLLFPYAASLIGDWNTGIAIANPSAFTTTPLSGSITFTLFPNDGDMVEYPTNDLSPGRGLNSDGFIPAGNTYTVLLSEILDAASFSGDFIGHFYVKTDFTGCRGMAYVTDFQSGAQAYLPYFGDNLDEGDVPSNTSK